MKRIILMSADGRGRGLEWDSPLPDEIDLESVSPEIQAMFLGRRAFVKTARVVDGAVVYEERVDDQRFGTAADACELATESRRELEADGCVDVRRS